MKLGYFGWIKGLSPLMLVICVVSSISVGALSFMCLRPTLNIDHDVRLKTIERIGDLCLLKVFDEYVINTNDENGIEGTFVAPCDAILSLDFKKIGLSFSNNEYFVSFPPIEVKQPRVDRNGLKTYEVSRGIKNMFKSTDPIRQAALTEAENRIRLEALSDRFVEKAKDRATNIVATLIRHADNRDSISIMFNWSEVENP